MPQHLRTTQVHSAASASGAPQALVARQHLSPAFVKVACLCLLTLVAFMVLGYHPYAEDGGIYAAALEAGLNPTLFPHDRAPGTDWVSGPTRYSVFVPLVASGLRLLHLPLSYGLLLLQLASVAATIAALAMVARLCLRSLAAAHWATLLLAAALGLPIAGTSLYLLDPYITARSLTTPLLLFATAMCLRRRWVPAILVWSVAAAVHPLMAAWGAVLLVPLWLVLHRQQSAAIVFAGSVVLALGCLQLASPKVDSLSLQLADTRAYWFLSQWHWYEIAGAVLPLCLLLTGLRWPAASRGWTGHGRALAKASCLSFMTGMTSALLFAHLSGRTVAVAQLQPLRVLHLAYPLFLLLFADTLQGLLTQRARPIRYPVPGTIRRSTVLGIAAAATVFALTAMQRSLYPTSCWLDLPWRAPANQWQQAFAWCREHTVPHDLFALDAAYTIASGEEAQGFRAVAQRDVLPDEAKDAGIAAVAPLLGPAWQAGVLAQTGLNQASDRERQARLLPLGVVWVVLSASAQTSLPCPYRNATAKVCRLQPTMAPAAAETRSSGTAP